jgi:hypothetical protein
VPVLAIWLTLVGYVIAITGKRNLGLSYQPQADGSIKAVDGKGNAAQAYSLMDVVQCQDPSIALQGQAAPLGAAKSSRPAGGPPPTAPNLLPLPAPAFNPIAIPRIQLPMPPRPAPVPPLGGPLGGLIDFERTLERDVYQGLHGLAGGLRGALSGIRIPSPAPRPLP